MRLVSVVIPVYNVEKYLEECINSVKNQTFENLEIILVDDGSTDSSSQICDLYAQTDCRIKVIHQNNLGLSMARNTGIKHATGSYIYFLDSDDYIAPNTIQILYDKIEEDNSDIVFFDANIFFDSKDILAPNMQYKRQKSYGSSSGSEMLLRLYTDGVFYTAVPLMLINLEYIRKIGASFYPGILHEDNLFTVNLYLKSKKVSHVFKALYFRRMRQDSIMTNPFSPNNFLGYFVCIRELVQIHNSISDDLYGKMFLKKFISSRSSLIVNEYFNLPLREQKMLNNTYDQLNEILSKCNYMENSALKRKLRHKNITRLYKKLRYLN